MFTVVWEIQSRTTETAVLAAKMMGLQALFGRCATLKCQASRPSHLDAWSRWGKWLLFDYVLVPLQKLSLPVKLEVETTALSDAHLLLGIESHSGLELVINGGVEKASCLRWVRSAPGSATAEAWSIRREIMCIPHDASQVSDGEGGTWMRFSLFVGSEEGLIIVTDGAQWGNYLPEEPLMILKSRKDLTISVGTFYHSESRWSICLGDAEGEEKTQRTPALKSTEFMKSAAANRQVQVSALGAGAGSIALGTAGAAAGVLGGGTVGALVGLVPAVFTFGLSIPIGMAVGGATGLVTGGAVGSGVGFAGGGGLACLAYRQRGLPGNVFHYASSRLGYGDDEH
eukprot:s210_g29.t1